MRAVKIDKAGLFLEDIPGDPPYAGKPETAPAPAVGHGLVRPRWNGEAWEEGEDSAVLVQLQKDGQALGERQWRNRELQRADVKVADALDRQQLDRYHAWCEYRIALRDMPAQSPDPFAWKRPEAPAV